MALTRIKRTMIKNYNRFLKKVRKLNVASFWETIEAVKKQKSLIRFGDGELTIINGGSIGFQKKDSLLAKRLKEILSSDTPNVIIAIPGPLGGMYSHLSVKAAHWWKTHTDMEYHVWLKQLNPHRQYYDSMISRFYVGMKELDFSKSVVNALKSIWNDKKLLIVEGFSTRMGVGNDLFDNARSVARILCPSENAFNKYTEILQEVEQMAFKYDLVLISLGPTAKVLAYDLHKSGLWAIDIGHIDNEYEWLLAGKGKRVLIPNKYCNEVDGGKITDQRIDNIKYNNEIVAIIV